MSKSEKDKYEPPENSPFESKERYIASLLLQQFRKPESARTEKDRDRIINLSKDLATVVFEERDKE